MRFGVAAGAMMDELAKIAGTSTPSIIAAPSPGGDGRVLKSTPSQPVSPQKIVGKFVAKTNLQKTNYTKPNTKVANPDVTLTAEQKALTPPAVRS
jgi:hypothetical protein